MARSLRWLTVTSIVGLALLLSAGAALADQPGSAAGAEVPSTDGEVLADGGDGEIGTAVVAQRSPREKTGPLIAPPPNRGTRPYVPDAAPVPPAPEPTPAAAPARVPAAPAAAGHHAAPAARSATAPSSVDAPAAERAARARAAVRDRLPEGSLQPATPAPILPGIGAEAGSTWLQASSTSIARNRR